MGQRRESMVLSEEEKEAIAYHEGGHAVLRRGAPPRRPAAQGHDPPDAAWRSASPSSCPPRSATSTDQDYLEDSLVRAPWAAASPRSSCSACVSTGANNDLVGATELARKMVREWGMCDRIGPMAWGSQGQVFLGEDLMHTRDYSDDTARVIDEEVERILREQEERCRTVLTEHRDGLDLVARALLEHETIDGAEVTRLHRAGPQRRRGPPRTATTAAPAPMSTLRAGHRVAGWPRPPHRVARPPTGRRSAYRALAQASSSGRELGSGAVPWSQSCGVEPGSRASATAAHRSVAVTGPRKWPARRPSASAMTTAAPRRCRSGGAARRAP